MLLASSVALHISRVGLSVRRLYNMTLSLSVVDDALIFYLTEKFATEQLKLFSFQCPS
jgi:hypothetical protein